MLSVASACFKGSMPFHLNRIPLPSAAKVLVLAPHPDDFDAIGVSMDFLHAHGHEIHVAVLTTGASGVEDGFAGATSDREKASIREQEQRTSCHLFGLPEDRLSFLYLHEDERGHQVDDAGNRDRLRAYLLERRPDLVFMPHGNDTNVAHRRTYEMFRAVALEECLSLWACLNRDAKTIGMRADLYMFFGDAAADRKRQLLRAHVSQQERNLRTRGYGFDDRVLKLNREAAQSVADAREPYAEVFELERFGR